MQSLSLNWPGVLTAVLLILAAVALAIMLLDLIFPRLRRTDSQDLAGMLAPRELGSERLVRRREAPPVRIIETAAVAGQSSAAQRAYWRSNLTLIGGLLLIWAIAAYVPTFFAAQLNQITVLNGFPLGYYLGAQGGPILFLVLSVVYAVVMGWHDRRMGGAQSGDTTEQRRLSRGLLLVLLVILGVIALLLLLESRLSLSGTVLGWIMITLTVVSYGVIGIRNRATSLDEYYVAGRRISAPINGLAIAADWMSAATFISLAGTLWLLGYEGLAYIIGWTGGYVLLAVLLAPYLRKFGQYTIPDLIGARYGGAAVRVTAAAIATIISFVYLTAQVSGVGIIMSRFLGVNFIIGVGIGLSAVLFCSFLGGMRAVTWTQVVQAIILMIAFLLPVGLLATRETGLPIPQLAYGATFAPIASLEMARGVERAYITPFDNWTIWNFLALTTCLMCGTAGLPHILIRFYTTPTVSQARHSASWALAFILLIYLAIPAYAAFARLNILRDVVGLPIKTLPPWAEAWGQAGLLTVRDENGDQILQLSELRIHPDLIVLATPEIVGLPASIGALTAVGGLTAALSTADGLLIVITSAVAHDIYYGAMRQRATTATRLNVGRVAMVIAAFLAGLTALQQIGIIVEMVAWAFSLAAATIFPALVLAIFWKRANRYGAVAGMIAGMLVTLTYIALNLFDRSFNVLGIASPAAGIFGMPINFIVAVCVSLTTAPPPPDSDALVDALRRP
jgi:cation/acetate symporter